MRRVWRWVGDMVLYPLIIGYFAIRFTLMLAMMTVLSPVAAISGALWFATSRFRALDDDDAVIESVLGIVDAVIGGLDRVGWAVYRRVDSVFGPDPRFETTT